MLSSSQRPVARAHRRGALGWLVFLSLGLHLALFSFLLVMPSSPPPVEAAAPFSLDVVAEQMPAEADPAPPSPAEPADPPTTPAAPVEADNPPPAPPPAPDPPPLAEQAETPPPEVPPQPPPPVVEAPAPVVPPPPSPPPVPPPLPTRAHPPPRPPILRPRPPPQQAPGRAAALRTPVNPAGEPAPATDGQDVRSRASVVNDGPAWMGKLKQWWDQRSFYPREASQTNEGGAVRVRIVIAADGQVMSVVLVQGSGSDVLDAAALAVFRNAHLPPFPPGTPIQGADVVVTLHYRPAGGG